MREDHNQEGNRVPATIAFLLFAVLLSLLVGGAIRFADKLRLDAFLSGVDRAGEQNVDSDNLFYESIGDAPAPLPQDALKRGRHEEPRASFTIELGMCMDAKDADQRVKQLSELGINAFYTPLHQEGRPLFRIRVGVFENEQVAVSYAGQIKQKHSTLEPKVSRL